MGEGETPQRDADLTGQDATGPADHELRDIARGDPGRHRLLRDALERLETGAAGPDLAEMAGEVMAGRITLRRAMTSRAYADAWRPHLEQVLKTVDEQRRSGQDHH